MVICILLNTGVIFQIKTLNEINFFLILIYILLECCLLSSLRNFCGQLTFRLLLVNGPQTMVNYNALGIE